jgi:hypothetical protein
MDQENEIVSLSNLCGGAVEEIFQREWAAVMANIGDVNTDPEAKRKLVLEFTITPFEARDGAQVTFACKSKTVPVEAVKGTIYLRRQGTALVAVSHNPQQIRMFDPKAAAANDKAN